MKYKDNEQSSLNGHGTGQPEGPKRAAAPATLLPTILSHLGLTDSSMVEGDQLLAALRDEKSSVRVAAIRSLGAREEDSSLPLLESALDDPDWEVRVAAVWALRAFGERAPVEALNKALDDEDGSVRAAALRVLAAVRGPISPELLTRMLEDADGLVREAAALTEEELQGLAPTELLAASLDDDRTIVREAAQRSQQQVRSEVHPTPPFTLERAMQIEALSNRYQLLAPIGRGGMSTIYRGRDMHMNRAVAIKVLRETFSTDPKFVARFQREAKAASALHHPNIVEVYDYGQADGNYYIVMELVQGTDLRRYLRSRGVLDVNRAAIIAHDIALGLAAAHRRGIVHRDVKPQNILVSQNGSVKLTDFGIVSVYQDINAKRLTTTGMTLGTIQYYAPEQALGEIVSPAADVYELGIVMYEMLTGRTPFDGDSPVTVAMKHLQEAPTPPSQLNPSIPAALEDIILHCLEKAPEKRFHDGSRLARALETFGDDQSGATVPAPPERALNVITATPIPSRSDNSTRGIGENIPPDSSDHGMDPDIQSESNDAGYVPAPLFNEPLYARQQLFASPPASEASQGFQPGSMRISGVVRPVQRNSRFVNILTILITIATLLLLGFSIYLASQLGFISLPFINTGSSSSAISTVPHLVGLDYRAALTEAKQAGFNLQSLNNIQTGVVIQQSPPSNDRALKGSTIIVEMGRSTPTLTVPQHLAGNSLGSAEVILQDAHIPYTVQSAGLDPSLGPNIVKSVNPPEGSPLQSGQRVTLYIVNLTNGTPITTPTPKA